MEDIVLVSQAARDARDRNYGDHVYWKYLDYSALEKVSYYMRYGDADNAKLMLTRSLSEALAGNKGE